MLILLCMCTLLLYILLLACKKKIIYFNCLLYFKQGRPIPLLKVLCPASFPTILALPASDWLSTPDPGAQQWVGQGELETKQESAPQEAALDTPDLKPTYCTCKRIKVTALSTCIIPLYSACEISVAV